MWVGAIEEVNIYLYTASVCQRWGGGFNRRTYVKVFVLCENLRLKYGCPVNNRNILIYKVEIIWEIQIFMYLVKILLKQCLFE